MTGLGGLHAESDQQRQPQSSHRRAPGRRAGPDIASGPRCCSGPVRVMECKKMPLLQWTARSQRPMLWPRFYCGRRRFCDSVWGGSFGGSGCQTVVLFVSHALPSMRWHCQSQPEMVPMDWIERIKGQLIGLCSLQTTHHLLPCKLLGDREVL